MKSKHTKLKPLLVGCLMAGSVFESAAALVQTSQSTGKSSTAYDSFITPNLVTTGQSSLENVTADPSQLNGTFYASGLNDGAGLASASANATYYAVVGTAPLMPNAATFQLTAGYNITNIQVISGWTDHNLGEQTFQLLFSVGGGVFTSIGTFTNNTSVNAGFNGPGSWMTTLADSGGIIATNVTGIQFIFMNPDTSNGASAVGASQTGNGSSGGTLIHEIQVFGSYYTNLPPPIVQTSQSTGSSSTAYDSFITSNLITTGQSSLASVTADISALSPTFTAAGLNDGIGLVNANANATYYSVLGSAPVMPNSDIFQLSAGYNITNIQVISGWTDHNLGEQTFQVLLSVGGGVFTSIGTFTNNTPLNAGFSGPGSWMTTLTGGHGVIATNVTGIEFIFMNPDTSNGTGSVGASQAGDGSDGGTVIHELQVFGTYNTNLTSTTPMATIPVTDTNILYGLTINDWVCETNFIDSTVEGAALTLGFQGANQVAIRVNDSQFTGVVASRYPIISWSINGGPLNNQQLTAGETSMVLSTGVTNPVIDLYIKGMSPFEDRYTGDVPPNSVEITGFLVNSNATTVAAVHPAKYWLDIGDSILSGDAALYAAGQGRPPDDDWAAADDGRASYGYLLANHFGYQETRLAYGGYDWGSGLANVPALGTLIDQKTSTISRLSGGLLNPVPGVVLINLGENGAPALSDVTNALFEMRRRVVPATKIIVMVPVAGTSLSSVTNDFAVYVSVSGDTNAYLVNLGPITYPTADGQHPTALGHEMIYQDALPFFDPIIKPAIIQNPQYGTSSTAFDEAIATNLIQAGQTSLSSVKVSHGPSISTLFSSAGLNDGSAAANTNLTYYGDNDSSGGNLPVTITFNLNTNIASGYNITNVQVISGWSDSDLANQNFQLLFSVNGGPFISDGVFINGTNTDALNNGDNAILETLSSGSGSPIASGVTGVQFVFSNPGGVQGGSGGTLIRELQVFGTPVLVPPVIGQPYISGGNLIITGSGGTPNAGYTWLTTTDLATPLFNWATNSTGYLNSGGSFTNSISINADNPKTFFRLRLP